MTTIFDILKPHIDEATRAAQIEAQDNNEYIQAARAACPRCIVNDKIEGEDLCADCKRDFQRGYEALSLAGRCANGMELGKGTLYHAVKIGSNAAMCGAKPGRRSAGWSSYPVASVTCPKCLKKLERDFDPDTMTRATDDDIKRVWAQLWGDLPTWMIRKAYAVNPELLDSTQIERQKKV